MRRGVTGVYGWCDCSDELEDWDEDGCMGRHYGRFENGMDIGSSRTWM
jgi:hypothetical protein